MNAIDRVLRRISEGRASRAQQLAADADGIARSRGSVGAAPTIGARVFDPVTGQEGIVRGHTSENLIVPAPRQ